MQTTYEEIPQIITFKKLIEISTQTKTQKEHKKEAEYDQKPNDNHMTQELSRMANDLQFYQLNLNF